MESEVRPVFETDCVMESRAEQIKNLGEGLAALSAFVPSSEYELNQWYDQAQQLIDGPLKVIGVPHFLWHYLSDADIRMKDEEYAEMQNGRVRILLQHLRSGTMPNDDQV